MSIKVGDRIIVTAGCEKENTIQAEGLIGEVIYIKNTIYKVKFAEINETLNIARDERLGTKIVKYGREHEAKEIEGELAHLTAEFEKAKGRMLEDIKRLREFSSDAEYAKALRKAEIAEVVAEVNAG